MTKASVSLNLPAALKAAAEDYAEGDGVSRNQFIAPALADKVGAFSASEFFLGRAVSADRARALEFLRTAPDAPPMGADELPTDQTCCVDPPAHTHRRACRE